jgi:hypothetical protein
VGIGGQEFRFLAVLLAGVGSTNQSVFTLTGNIWCAQGSVPVECLAFWGGTLIETSPALPAGVRVASIRDIPLTP